MCTVKVKTDAALHNTAIDLSSHTPNTIVSAMSAEEPAGTHQSQSSSSSDSESTGGGGGGAGGLMLRLSPLSC